MQQPGGECGGLRINHTIDASTLIPDLRGPCTIVAVTMRQP